eukprot:3372966-Prymnesium_polylepis.1
MADSRSSTMTNSAARSAFSAPKAAVYSASMSFIDLSSVRMSPSISSTLAFPSPMPVRPADAASACARATQEGGGCGRGEAEQGNGGARLLA